MAHAAKYGNFSADAVASVIAGRDMPRTKNAIPAKAPPERVRLWLEGLDVETGDLAAYDRIVDRAGEDQEVPHGEG